MPKFRCPYGHVDAKSGQLVPLVHESRARCSIYVKLRAEHKVDLFGRPIGGADISSYLVGHAPPSHPDAPAPSGGLTPEPPSVGGAAAPADDKPSADRPKEGLLKRLGTGLSIRHNPVGTTPPGAGGPPAGESDWIVSEETSQRFWEVIFAFIETVLGLVTQYFEIAPIPKEIFVIDAGQEFVFRTALRPTVTNFLKKVMGARSPEEADKIVAGLSGLLGFGMLGIKIVIHFAINLPKSPKLAKWRERREVAKKERARIAAEKAAAEGRNPAVSPGARPAGGG